MLDDEYEIMQVRGLTLSINEKDEIQMIWFHKFNAFKVLDWFEWVTSVSHLSNPLV